MKYHRNPTGLGYDLAAVADILSENEGDALEALLLAAAQLAVGRYSKRNFLTVARCQYEILDLFRKERE